MIYKKLFNLILLLDDIQHWRCEFYTCCLISQLVGSVQVKKVLKSIQSMFTPKTFWSYIQHLHLYNGILTGSLWKLSFNATAVFIWLMKLFFYFFIFSTRGSLFKFKIKDQGDANMIWNYCSAMRPVTSA